MADKVKEITFRKLNEQDKDQVFSLIDTVLAGLENPDFFYPFEQWELDSMFDDVNYAHLYGAFDGKKLVGMCQLYVSANIPGLSDLCKEFDLSENKCCELGGCLVLPEYRGQGIATTLSTLEYDLAKKLDYDYIISTTHPNNLSAAKTLEKTKLELVKVTTLSNGYTRKVYLKKLKD